MTSNTTVTSTTTPTTARMATAAIAMAVHWNEEDGEGGVVGGGVGDEANGGAGDWIGVEKIGGDVGVAEVEEMGGADERVGDEGWTVSAETELLTTAEGHEVLFSWKKKGTDQKMRVTEERAYYTLYSESPPKANHTTKDISSCIYKLKLFNTTFAYLLSWITATCDHCTTGRQGGKEHQE